MLVERNIRWRSYASRQEAADAAARHIASLLRLSIRCKGRAAMIASGGESPRALYASLSEAPVDWKHVDVVPSDERCVDSSNSASNAGMIRSSLLTRAAEAASLVPLYETGVAPTEGLARAAANVAALPRPYAVTVLGLGDDGHTASLFPDSSNIDTELTSNASVVEVRIPRLEHPRISLTPRVLLDTREVCLFFFGNAKRHVYEEALESGPITAMPIRIFLNQTAVPVTVFWAP